MRYERAWPQQCWKSCANRSNIVGLRLAITEQKKCCELLAEKFDRFQTLHNNTQQHPTTCNRVCKRTQHVTSNNAGSCGPTMLHPFARGLTKKFLEALRCSRAKQRQRNVEKKCDARAKLLFCYLDLLVVFTVLRCCRRRLALSPGANGRNIVGQQLPTLLL